MNTASHTIAGRAMRTPRAAAVAGIVFSILFAATIILTAWAVPPGSERAGQWVNDDAKRRAVSISLQLLPFAGIAFLWFVGVLRDRIGKAEDRFFATVFLGSGLIFVAMFFVAGAMVGGLMSSDEAPTGVAISGVWPFGQRTVAGLANVYGLRMAAVFTLSTTTIASRLQIIPRWLAFFGYLTAIVLLIGVGYVAWLELAFPAGVFIISVHILVVSYRQSPGVVATDD